MSSLCGPRDIPAFSEVLAMKSRMKTYERMVYGADSHVVVHIAAHSARLK